MFIPAWLVLILVILFWPQLLDLAVMLGILVGITLMALVPFAVVAALCLRLHG